MKATECTIKHSVQGVGVEHVLRKSFYFLCLVGFGIKCLGEYQAVFLRHLFL
jgi:hypothetical protein